MNKNFNDNPIANSWKKRYETQPVEIQEKLDALYKKPAIEYQLKVIKKTRKLPDIGTAFLVNPMANMYFQGVVINSKINNIHGDNLFVITIFKKRGMSADDFSEVVDWNELLLKPYIVGKEYWTKGFFYNTSIKIDIPRNIDYGFYKIGKDIYVNEYGEKINNTPALAEMFGVATITGVAYEIRKEIIIEKLDEQMDP